MRSGSMNSLATKAYLGMRSKMGARTLMVFSKTFFGVGGWVGGWGG